MHLISICLQWLWWLWGQVETRKIWNGDTLKGVPTGQVLLNKLSLSLIYSLSISFSPPYSPYVFLTHSLLPNLSLALSLYGSLSLSLWLSLSLSLHDWTGFERFTTDTINNICNWWWSITDNWEKIRAESQSDIMSVMFEEQFITFI